MSANCYNLVNTTVAFRNIRNERRNIYVQQTVGVDGIIPRVELWIIARYWQAPSSEIMARATATPNRVIREQLTEETYA